MKKPFIGALAPEHHSCEISGRYLPESREGGPQKDAEEGDGPVRKGWHATPPKFIIGPGGRVPFRARPRQSTPPAHPSSSSSSPSPSLAAKHNGDGVGDVYESEFNKAGDDEEDESDDEYFDDDFEYDEEFKDQVDNVGLNDIKIKKEKEDYGVVQEDCQSDDDRGLEGSIFNLSMVQNASTVSTRGRYDVVCAENNDDDYADADDHAHEDKEEGDDDGHRSPIASPSRTSMAKARVSAVLNEAASPLRLRYSISATGSKHDTGIVADTRPVGAAGKLKMRLKEDAANALLVSSPRQRSSSPLHSTSPSRQWQQSSSPSNVSVIRKGDETGLPLAKMREGGGVRSGGGGGDPDSHMEMFDPSPNKTPPSEVDSLIPALSPFSGSIGTTADGILPKKDLARIGHDADLVPPPPQDRLANTCTITPRTATTTSSTKESSKDVMWLRNSREMPPPASPPPDMILPPSSPSLSFARDASDIRQRGHTRRRKGTSYELSRHTHGDGLLSPTAISKRVSDEALRESWLQMEQRDRASRLGLNDAFSAGLVAQDNSAMHSTAAEFDVGQQLGVIPLLKRRADAGENMSSSRVSGQSLSVSAARQRKVGQNEGLSQQSIPRRRRRRRRIYTPQGPLNENGQELQHHVTPVGKGQARCEARIHVHDQLASLTSVLALDDRPPLPRAVVGSVLPVSKGGVTSDAIPKGTPPPSMTEYVVDTARKPAPATTIVDDVGIFLGKGVIGSCAINAQADVHTKILTIVVHSNWGDSNYVGLNGICLYDVKGQPLSPEQDIASIGCFPEGMVDTASSIADSEALGKDPRVVTNLINGKNYSRDDLCSWLTHTSTGSALDEDDWQEHVSPAVWNVCCGDSGGMEHDFPLAVVTIKLQKPTVLGAIALWNYNRSRAHACRGAAQLTLLSDHTPVCDEQYHREARTWELPMAGGVLSGDPADCCAVILLGPADNSAIDDDNDVDGNGGVNTAAAAAATIGVSEAIVRDVMRQVRGVSSPGFRDSLLARQRANIFTSRPRTADQDRSVRYDEHADASRIYEETMAKDMHSNDGDDQHLRCGELNDVLRDRTDRMNVSHPYDSSEEPSRAESVKLPPTATEAKAAVPSALFPGDLADLSWDLTSSLVDGLNALDELVKRDLCKDNEEEREEFKLFKESEAAAASPQALVSIREATWCKEEEQYDAEPMVAPDEELDGSLDSLMAHDVRDDLKRPSPTPSPTMTAKTTVRITILDTHGDSDYVGLAGLALLYRDAQTGELQQVSTPSLMTLFAQPHSLADIGHFDDPRVPENLLNGRNQSTDDTDMWLIPFTPGGSHTLDIRVPSRAEPPVGLRVWNYNKSPDDVFRGVRCVKLTLDHKVLGCAEIRMATGCSGVELGQSIYFHELLPESTGAAAVAAAGSAVVTPLTFLPPCVRQDYETHVEPSGQLLKLSLLSNFGDEHFIGLDAIEIWDKYGTRLTGVSANVTASPSHIHGDARVPSRLLMPPCASGQSSWLTPLMAQMSAEERRALAAPGDRTPKIFSTNSVFVMLDRPVSIGCIRLINYSKTPRRGVREVKVDLDGKLLYIGSLQQSTGPCGFDEGLAIIFTRNAQMFLKFKAHVHCSGEQSQDVLHINERTIAIKSKGMYEKPPATAEGIVVKTVRPSTGYIA